jgi:NAD(P)-dependent dehydrogenase (short-subunit alcohol dehydrogenase family)
MINRVNELGEAAAGRARTSFDSWRAEAEAGTVLGRFGDPLRFLALVAFSTADSSSYMNGTCIIMDDNALESIT